MAAGIREFEGFSHRVADQAPDELIDHGSRREVMHYGFERGDAANELIEHCYEQMLAGLKEFDAAMGNKQSG